MKKYEKIYIAHFGLYEDHLSSDMTVSEALRLIKGNHCLNSSKIMILLETKEIWKQKCSGMDSLVEYEHQR